MGKDNLREKLENVELSLDDYNAKFGSESNLCLFCYANSYSGRKGINHNSGCVILELRQVIVMLPDEEEIRKQKDEPTVPRRYYEEKIGEAKDFVRKQERIAIGKFIKKLGINNRDVDNLIQGQALKEEVKDE